MKTITESVDFNCEAKTLWDILSDASRCDWVPTVNEIKLEEDCRIFEMQGMGKVKEKILINDSNIMTFQYSAIETIVPLKHHLATMKVSSVDANLCNLLWQTEIDPESYADAIHRGMLVSIEGIKKVLER